MDKKINSQNGEVIISRKTSFSTIKRENVSVQPVGDHKVIVYDFVNTYEKGPSGSDEDYRVIKKPKKIEEYDIEKVMVERCKGQDLKSMIARVSQTGDVGILHQREVAYGDGSLYPRNLGDALDKGVQGDKFLSKLTSSEREQLIKMSKDPKAFESYVRSQADKITKSNKTVDNTVVEEKKGDVK